MIESRNWSFLCIYIPPNAKSKQWSPSTTTYKCLILVVKIYWKYLMACKFFFVLNLAFGWTIFLQIEKWVKCHLLLKFGLKTSSYDIWFLCALFASNFWFSKAFMGYLWVSLILLDLFFISRSYSLIWVFGWCSC